MVKAIKIIGKERKLISVENPRGSTLWHHPDLLALMEEVGVDQISFIFVCILRVTGLSLMVQYAIMSKHQTMGPEFGILMEFSFN